MGPADYRAARVDHCVATTRGAKNGWGRRARTPITRARTWRPTIRRSPSSVGHCTGRGFKVSRRGPLTTRVRAACARLLHVVLQRAAGLEARDATGGDLDDLAGARVATVALGPAAHEEGPEAADGHLPAPLQRVEHAVEQGVEGALGGDLRAAGGLGHGRDQVRLDHVSPLTTRALGPKSSAHLLHRVQ